MEHTVLVNIEVVHALDIKVFLNGCNMISETQLQTWANQGPIQASKNTYTSVKAALEHPASPIAKKIANGSIEIRLQGSYANDTNIRGDSDVDILVRLEDTFHSNKQKLPPEQLKAHERAHAEATYKWDHLRADVLDALTKYYTSSSLDATGNKSIKVLSNGSRLKADVVPVVVHKEYKYFHGHGNQSSERGVAFYHLQTKASIVNYPDHHYKNGVAKHAESNEWFKPTVRIFKNMVSKLVDDGFLTKDIAPSYFLQCLIYNVPSYLFGTSYQQSVYNTLEYLSNVDLGSFKCQNEIHSLFDSGDTHWNVVDAQQTINALVALWNRGI